MEEQATELDRRRSSKIAVISQINRRNRKSTQQNVEMALAVMIKSLSRVRNFVLDFLA